MKFFHQTSCRQLHLNLGFLCHRFRYWPTVATPEIEDVKRGAELSFSGPLRGPLTFMGRWHINERDFIEFSNKMQLFGYTYV